MQNIVALGRRLAPLGAALVSGLALTALAKPSHGHEGFSEDPHPATSGSATIAAAAASSAPPEELKAEPATITVKAEKGYTAASADEIRNRDLMLRPRFRPGDIVEVVPGLFAVQHAGGGKANQYFLRGFDADHGTDIAFFVDGVPINMVSHGHGQGFADLHFIIPELVSTLTSQKGPYAAKYGDFATAGAIDMHYFDHLHESSVSGQIGRFGIYRALFMVAPELGDDWSTIVAGEAFADDGPFTHKENLRRFNGFARATRHMGAGALSLTFMTYASGWHASGQVPLRAVGTQELPTEFDSIDPTEGGSSQRNQFSVSYAYKKDEDEAHALIYAVRYRFSLFSDFTLFARDPVNGDEIEQDDQRTMIGTSWSFKRTKKLGPFVASTTFGLQARSDEIDNGLHHAVARKFIETVGNYGVTETSVGLFGEEDFKITSWLRTVFGLRLDRFDVAVKDRLEQPSVTGPATSGISGSTLASPKMSAVITPFADWDIYLNFGRGFHSNDARGSTRRLDPMSPTVTLLTKATGYELGTRVHLLDRIDLAAALFRLDLESETVWNGDEGTTASVGPTRRTGVEIEARAKLTPWLFLDADATFSKAVFRDNAGNGNAVALAPTRTFAGGISVKHPLGFFGALRFRSIADRPANDGQDRIDKPLDAKGWTLFDAVAGYRYKDVELAVDVRNLLNSEWKEVQFANTSKLRKESEATQDIHFTPGWPFTALARVTAYF